MKKHRIIFRNGGQMLVNMNDSAIPNIVARLKEDCTRPGILAISPTGFDSDAMAFLRIEEVVAIEVVTG